MVGERFLGAFSCRVTGRQLLMLHAFAYGTSEPTPYFLGPMALAVLPAAAMARSLARRHHALGVALAVAGALGATAWARALPARRELFVTNDAQLHDMWRSIPFDRAIVSFPDDMHWKQELSRYSRGLFGIFGSECGREWAIPCADFFEGLSGVAGKPYHNVDLHASLGGEVLPPF